MKTNTKKTIATKSKTPAKKTAVKATKPVAKTSAKKVAVKAAPVAKKPVSKVSPATKAKTVAKAPAKAVKAAPKAVKAPAKPVKAVKTPAKAVKVAPKAAKAPVKAAPVAKKAVIAPVKAAPKAAIVVKMPENQNQNQNQNQNAPAVKTAIRATMIASTRPTSIVVAKASSASAVASAAANRPVYRPIQVINKPLTPLQPTRQMAPVAKEAEKVEFKKGDYVVYPAHGVGEIEAVETQIIGGMEIKLYAIAFEKDRMRLKVPVFKAHASGLRRLSTSNRMDDALKTLQGRAQIRRAMWSRRAQEYETKINSGDPVAIAEVLRDLKRSNDESEQSYSERQIYQSALERLAREVAAVEKITEIEAAERLENMIKSKRSRAGTAAAEEEMKEAVNA